MLSPVLPRFNTASQKQGPADPSSQNNMPDLLTSARPPFVQAAVPLNKLQLCA